MSDLTIEELKEIEKTVGKLNIEVRLITDCGLGSQFVHPEKIRIENDGTVTVDVRAWRDKSYDK